MSDWSDGYIAEVGYTFGYYNELNPVRAQLALLLAGLAPPVIEQACELGFGQGISINVHASAGPAVWYGTDFNPAQVATAREMAEASGHAGMLFDESFQDFCARADLPEFDYIGLHGVWSWISDANRAVIVDFVGRRLKPGGVLYVSYNTQPGWAAMVPIRDLLAEHADRLAAPGAGIGSRVEGAFAFVERLLAASPAFAEANPQIIERVRAVRERDRNYLAHEYFNRDWRPMGVTRMSEWLAAARLDYGCSAHYLDQVDTLNLTAAHQALLREISDPMFREAVRDFCVNQQFRRDIWVKGARRLTIVQQAERLRSVSVVLVTRRADVSLVVGGALGEGKMDEQVYGSVLDALADHTPRTLGQLELSVKGRGVTLPQLLQVVMVLVGKGDLAVAQEGGVISASAPVCGRLNRHLMLHARHSGQIGCLASPVTGGGLAVGRLQQLFLLARERAMTDPEQWANWTWRILSSQGQAVKKEGRTLETAEENLAELNRMATEFAERALPALVALKVAAPTPGPAATEPAADHKLQRQ